MKNKVEMLKVEGVRICLIDGEAYYHFYDFCEYIKKINAQKEHPRGISVTSIAKEYGMSGVKLNEYLCGKHIQYKCKGVWHINSKYGKKGYVVSVSARNKKTHMYWTYEGKTFIEKLLEEDGYQKVKAD